MALLLLFACVVFWSVTSKLDIDGRGDIAHYLVTGLRWLNGTLSYGELYRPNRGFAVLCGLMAMLFDNREPLLIVQTLIFPFFLLAVFFFYRTFLHISGHAIGFWATFLVIATPTVNLAVRHPQPENMLLCVFSLALYLSVSRKAQPLIIGVLCGAAFWLRSQMIMFLPCWPILFADSDDRRRTIKDALLFWVGAALPVVVQYLVDHTASFGGYSNVATRPMDIRPDQILHQFKRLTQYRIELALYAAGFFSILLPSLRAQIWRLWCFATAPLAGLLGILFFTGITVRPGAFLFMLIPYIFFAFLALQELVTRTQRLAVRITPEAFTTVILLAGLITGRISGIARYIYEPEMVTQRMHAFPLDHRDTFRLLPKGATVLVEGAGPFIYTRVSMPDSALRVLSCPELKNFEVDARLDEFMDICTRPDLSTDDPFQDTIDLINQSPDAASATALAVWRYGPPERIAFPSSFSDIRGDVFTLIARKNSSEQAFALYGINKS